MKTTKEWFETLDERIREKALKNMTKPDDQHPNIVSALANGFNWNTSPEGIDYWNKALVRHVLETQGNISPNTNKNFKTLEDNLSESQNNKQIKEDTKENKIILTNVSEEVPSETVKNPVVMQIESPIIESETLNELKSESKSYMKKDEFNSLETQSIENLFKEKNQAKV